MRSKPIGPLSALALLVGLAGPACSLLSPQKDETRYAVLASVDELPGGAAPAPAPASGARVGLGPVALPEYLRRTEMVSREEGTKIVISRTERWAEPLDRAIVRVLAVDLERALGVARIVPHPWYPSDRPDVQIEIEIARCEREGERVVVAARWTVRDLRESGAAPIERESRIERAAATSGGASTALALSQALAELCREIAAAGGSAAGGQGVKASTPPRSRS